MQLKKKHSACLFGEILGMLLGAAVLLYFLPRAPFITPAYAIWLPIGLVALITNGILKTLVHTTDNVQIVRILRIFSHGVSFYSTYWLRVLFPFNFAYIGIELLNPPLRFALLFTLFALSFAIVIETIKLITLTPLEEKLE